MAFRPRALMNPAEIAPSQALAPHAEAVAVAEAEPRQGLRTHDRALVWLRRDIRLDDNRTLIAAAERAEHIDLAFVFDHAILKGLPARDRRVEFLWASVMSLKNDLEAMGHTLFVLHGDPVEEIPQLARQLGASIVFCGRDCEPQSHLRDSRVAKELSGNGAQLECVWDHLALPADLLHTGAGGFYSVYGPFHRAWEKTLNAKPELALPQSADTALLKLTLRAATRSYSLKDLGFEPTDLDQKTFEPGVRGANNALADFMGRIHDYEDGRNRMGAFGGSHLSPYLRFGLISPRQLLLAGKENGTSGAQVWIKELAWREFGAHLLWHRPDLAQGAPFNARPRDSGHLTDSMALAAWQEGQTGFPLIDAGMRELAQTGFMHNRVRMATASFLCKDLLIDWRFGEAWFALLLLDFDLSSNNANWQWCAGTGADAAPFFRIFNPVSQGQKFDADGAYTARWVPELAQVPAKWIHCPWEAPAEELAKAGVVLGDTYPHPMIDRKMSRARALAWSKGADARAFTQAYGAAVAPGALGAPSLSGDAADQNAGAGADAMGHESESRQVVQDMLNQAIRDNAEPNGENLRARGEAGGEQARQMPNGDGPGVSASFSAPAKSTRIAPRESTRNTPKASKTYSREKKIDSRRRDKKQ